MHVITPESEQLYGVNNNSVFELQKRISTIEIGTVDKFQGQEAAVVIDCLASS